MADKQEAPQAVENTQPGSLWEAQDALLKMMEPETETPETEEAQPTEEEESTEETQDESLEEESEEEEEAGEAEEESEESDEEAKEELLYAVTVNGEEQEVTLEELTKGYSRQSDYTRKTQEIANNRKGMETLQQQYNSEISQIQQERQQYLESLNQIISNTASGLDKFVNVDWNDLKESDPLEYVTKREEFREAQEQVQAMQQEHYVAQQRQSQDIQRFRTKALQEEHGKLVSVLPDWAEPEKQKKIVSEIRSYASGQGFSDEELNSLVDHRSLLVLMKAQKYDKLQKADIKSKKLKNKPRVIRAGAGKDKKEDSRRSAKQKMKRLRHTGHVDDAASLLEDMFNS
jgi:hypothetical protein